MSGIRFYLVFAARAPRLVREPGRWAGLTNLTTAIAMVNHKNCVFFVVFCFRLVKHGGVHSHFGSFDRSIVKNRHSGGEPVLKYDHPW